MMKRTIMTCLMAVGVCLTAKAVNTITLTNVSGHPGDEVEVEVMLTNDVEVTALEVLIPLADVLSYVDGSATLNEERCNGHTLSAATRNGELSIVIYNFSLQSFKGTEGAVCRFKLKLGKEPATYVLNPEVVLSDAKGCAIESGVKAGMVSLLSPKMEVITSTIDYGRVPIRGSYAKTLSIRNSGNELLHISDIAFDNDDLSISPVPCTIAPGITQNFTLTYEPKQRGAITSNVTITSNAINPKTGKAVVRAQPYSVNELHVQRVEGMSDEEVIVVLKMNNMEPIVGAQCEFTLPTALKFVEGSAKKGARCEETDHVAMGFVSDDNRLTLLLYSPSNAALPEGDGELMTFRVRLDGKKGSYLLNPQEVVLGNVEMENMTSATSSNYVVIKSPTFSGTNALNMGNVAVTDKATATYAISNSGNVDLVISKVTFLAEGYAIESDLPLTIKSGKKEMLTVSYTPTEEGSHKTTMQVYTNDPANRMHSVVVSGEVYEPNHIVVSGDNTKEGYRFTFAMDNYTEIVAIQMTVKWLPGMKTSNAALIPTERMKDHSYLVTDMDDGIYQVLVYSMSNAPISGNSGELFTLDYTAEEGITYQDTELRVEDIILSNANGTNYVSEGMVSAEATFSNFMLRFVVDGETISEQFIKKGTEIVVPEVANREGYTFAWMDEIPETMSANDVTIHGVFTANKYLVVFKVGEEVIASDLLEYGSSIVAPEAPEVEGYTFEGWEGLFETVPAYDVEFIAVYKEKVYAVEEIILNQTTATLMVSKSLQLIATVAPENATDSSVLWSSSDTNIATVDEQGMVEGIAVGDVTITATANDGSGVIASCQITVEEYRPDFVEITINQYGSGTYSSEYALDFREVKGLKAYVATGYNYLTHMVTLLRVDTSKPGTGLFIKGTPYTSYEVPVMEFTADCTLNMLVATLEKTKVDKESSDGLYINYKYTVAKGDGASLEPMFYPFVNGSSLSAGKAYLQIPKDWLDPKEERAIRYRFDEKETTGMDDIESADNSEQTAVIYDLMGRRVTSPKNGEVYIINNKKVVY